MSVRARVLMKNATRNVWESTAGLEFVRLRCQQLFLDRGGRYGAMSETAKNSISAISVSES
jgi:hypothetical protein